MAANIDLQVNRGLAAREIRALDEMLGNLTETQQFAEKLLAEIDKSQTHQVRLLKEKKNPPEGGKPMSF